MMFASCDAANLLATTIASGFSNGIKVTAVRTFNVLAGPNSPCGSLAASTWPVPAFAITHAEAGTSGIGRAGCPSGRTTVPPLAMSGPPTAWAATLPSAGTGGRPVGPPLPRAPAIALGAAVAWIARVTTAAPRAIAVAARPPGIIPVPPCRRSSDLVERARDRPDGPRADRVLREMIPSRCVMVPTHSVISTYGNPASWARSGDATQLYEGFDIADLARVGALHAIPACRVVYFTTGAPGTSP